MAALRHKRRSWLITGVAGFIGSHLLETLLRGEQTVVGLDNFLLGTRENLDEVRESVGDAAWQRFRMIEGDIREPATVAESCAGVEIVLHQAALGSVPRSLAEPVLSHDINVTGTLQVLEAARAAGVRRLVYASSSAVYGDEATLPKREWVIGRPLSPYAASKRMNEIHAGVWQRAYGLSGVGLRYFNVYGPRQDPNGAYAAVIPKWITVLRRHEPILINGDGETSRDFCFVADVVQANVRAALVDSLPESNPVFNVAWGQRTTLNQLLKTLQAHPALRDPLVNEIQVQHRDFRAGDIPHSLADITQAKSALGYEPQVGLPEGLAATIESQGK